MTKKNNNQQSNKQFFMMVRNGFVQRMEFQGEKTWVTATSLDDLNRFIKHIDGWKDGIRGSLIGSVQGETLETHIALALSEGCTKILNVRWEDGVPLLDEYGRGK